MDDDGKWSAADYVPHAPDAVSVLMSVLLLFACWTSYRTAASVPRNPWAVEHQTNVAGKDVIIRCRDKSFCPIPVEDGPSFVDTDL